MDGNPTSISQWRVAMLHTFFFVLSTISVISLRAPVWLMGAMVYCMAHRSTLIGERLFPLRLWQVLLAFLATSAVCNVVANALTSLHHKTWSQQVTWRTLYPLWALLGVQQWDARDRVNTIVCPTVTTLVLGAYLLILRLTLAGRVLSRSGATRMAQGTSALRRLLPHSAGVTSTTCRLAAGSLLSSLSWATAWTAKPSVVGLSLESLAFVFTMAFLYVEHCRRHRVRRTAPSGEGAEGRTSRAFATAVAVVFLLVCVTQNSAFFPLTNGHSDWCSLLGIGPAPMDTVSGLRRAMQMVGMAVIFFGASVMHRCTVSPASAISESGASATVADAGEVDSLLSAGDQRGPLPPASPNSPPSMSARQRGPHTHHRRTSQVVAIVCVTALLAYAVYYPSLVSIAVWLVHLCCCVGGLVQRPMVLSSALRIGLAGVLVVLCCMILLQYVSQTMAGNTSSAAWVQWSPAKPAYTDDSRAVVAQVVAEHLITLLLGVYVSVAGVEDTSGGSSRADEEARPASSSPPLVSRMIPSADADGHLADCVQVMWLREQLRDAAADRRKLRKLFEVAVGRPPHTLELDALCAAAVLEQGASSSVASRGGLTVEEVAQFLAKGPFYTYTVILCTFVLGTSGATMDPFHAACLVLSLGVSVIGGNALLHRRVRLVPPVWVAIVVGVQLCYSLFAVDPEKGSQQHHRLTPPVMKPSPTKVALRNDIGPTSIGWDGFVPCVYAQLVLMWCSRYTPEWLTDWANVSQCLSFRCRWALFLRTVRQVAGFVALAWIALLLPRSASVTVLVLLLFAAALLQHLRWHRLAYVWRRFLVVGYCGAVLMCMLTAEVALVQPRLWRLLHALGCPPGSEGRCAQDIGLPADSAKWLTPLSIPWWLVIVLAAASASPTLLPSSLLSSLGAAPATIALEAQAARCWRGLVWWPQVLSDGLSVILLASMTYTALQRPSLLVALYLVGPALGVFPCWTYGVAAVHTALQCTYQLWFSPAWLDTETRFGVSLAELIGLWRPSPVMSWSAGLPSMLTVAAAPLLMGAVQSLQLKCALMAEWRVQHMETDVSNPARVWGRLRRTFTTHLYPLLLWVLLSLTQRIALGWGVGVLAVVVWATAEVRSCGVLQRRRWLFRACKTATVSLMALAYVLHWLHTMFPSWSVLARYPWLLGGGASEGKTEVELGRVYCAAAAACAVLRVSSGAPRDGECVHLFQHAHGPNFFDWLKRRTGQPLEIREGLAAPLSQTPPDEAHHFCRHVADTFHCDDPTAGETDALLLAEAPAPPRKGGAFVSVTRLVPLVACGSIGAGAAKRSTPCVLSVALLLAGLSLAVRHARSQWNFWRRWRLTVVLYALLPLTALFAACPHVRDAIPALPHWVGLLIGFSEDASHVDGNALVFSHWHIVLFSLLWLQSCVYNSPEWCATLLCQRDEERRLGEARHAALKRRLLTRVAKATEQSLRIDREIRLYLDTLRTGACAAVASRVVRTRDVEYGEEDGDEGDDADRERVPMPPPPPMASVTETEEAYGALDYAGALPAPPLPLSGANGRGDEATQPPMSFEQPQPSPLLWWRERCVWWLRWTCNKLAAYTYHPSEYRLSVAGPFSAAVESSALTLRLLGQHALRTAVQVVLHHTHLALLGCSLINSLLTGCLWELLGLFYLLQVALAYYPHAPRVVYRAFGAYLVTGVLLKEVVSMWAFFSKTSLSIITALSWTVLPLMRQGRCSSHWSHMRIGQSSSRGALCYNTLWMDVVTMGVLVLHDRMCIIHGVYVEGGQQQQQQSREPDSTGTSVKRESPVPCAGGAPPSASEATATAASPVAASLLLSPLSHASGSSDGTFRAFLVTYYKNLLAVPGVGEDWYISYTTIDFLALLFAAVFYSRMAGNDNTTLQDNVQNNLLPGPMALLLCISVLQLVMDRMLYMQRCMKLKALANCVCSVSYTLLYWWWRNAMKVWARGLGNAYFGLKVLALLFSVKQVSRGFPLHRRRDTFTTHLGSLVSYTSFTAYRALPFLWELCTLVDWTVLRTSLSLQEYLTVEDIYVHIYQCRERYLAKRRNGEKLGDTVALHSKWAFGVSRIALVLLALLGPLLYYSTYNPSTVTNSATQLNFQLSFFGAYDFFASAVHGNVTTPAEWWTWIERTRPTLASYGLMAAGKTVQLMEFTSCSSSLWMASPQALQKVLAGLRAAASNASSAYMLQTLEISRSVSDTASAAEVSLVNRWPIPWHTAQDLVAILEQETRGGSSGESSSSGVVAAASLPFFYSPFVFNRASRLDGLPASLHSPHRNYHNCTLQLIHDRDVALHSLVRYWCLHCAPLFPEGNVPSANVSSAAEWRCLTTGEGCENFNYEDVESVTGNRTLWARPGAYLGARTAGVQVPMHMVIISDTVVMGISFLKGIGIVALYTTFVLALGRLLRSVLANQASTLLYSNMANPAALENMVRCIEMAREYGDLRLEHAIYLELVDLLRSAERLLCVTGSLRCMYADAGHEDLFRLGQVRRRESHRDPLFEAHEGTPGERPTESGVPPAAPITSCSR
ncbi:hypothetical protein LSCM1_00358 [Leishmania martiniquensis]|uniref:Piezo non-specific cation channel R-Ras-binding domain-containing protein n=1 Tax=Leishmania martiniquensis TaxID=1580590 RepID=A0A836GHV2_9TRYP|nr:hypothetical protein LSCM1_00358 [Leishmania martiniquensis]